MADHRGALAIGAAGPVGASRVIGPRNSSAILLAAGQDIVLVWCVAATLDRVALLIERGLLVDLVLVTVQIGDAGCDLDSLGVRPWAAADPILGIDPALALRPEIRVPL